MIQKDATINMPEMMSFVTMHVTLRGMRELRLRVRLGCQLLRLAARVLGCVFEIDFEEEEETDD